MAEALTSIHGRALGLGATGQLTARGIDISRPCVDATITVGDESSNARAITIQLLDANGKDIDYVETVDVYMFTTAARTAFVTTGGSTGIAIGTDGAMLTVVAKKYFVVTSEADGDIDLTYTDTGTEAAFVGLRLPNGRFVMADVTCA